MNQPLDKYSDILKNINNRLNKPQNAIMVIFAILLVIWLASGIYIVKPNEQAAVKVFGKFTTIKNPGPHYHFPFPIGSVDKAEVTAVHRTEIGFRSNNRGVSSENIRDESRMLTGDENIVSIGLIVQYKIANVADYLYNVDNVEVILKDATESAIREVTGSKLIDDVLTTGKDIVQLETRTIIQGLLNDYGAGLDILAVQLQDVIPPLEVADAFKDVASAREDKNRFINEADSYANQVIPQARADAASLLEQANTYSANITNRAIGDASRFDAIYASYKNAPTITEKRLYLDTMNSILSAATLVIFDGNIDNLNPIVGVNEPIVPKNPKNKDTVGVISTIGTNSVTGGQ